MPTDDPTQDPPPPAPAPPKAEPAPPAGPTKDEIRDMVREALAETLGGGGKPPEAPDLSSPAKLEAYVEQKTREALEVIRAEEAKSGTPPPDPGPDPTPQPEKDPTQKTNWQQKVQRFLWGSVET